MQEYKIVLTKSASKNLDQIALYIKENDSEYSAAKVIKKIHHKINSLNYFPKRKRILGYSKIFWMVHTGKYNILYTINDRRKTVNIFRIMFAAQDYTRFLK